MDDRATAKKAIIIDGQNAKVRATGNEQFLALVAVKIASSRHA